MKRNIISIVLFAFSVSSFAFSFIVNGIVYNTLTTFDNTVEVTSGGNYSGIVNIPESVNYNGVTHPITAIGDNAFYQCSDLTEISIPATVIYVGQYAFYNCTKLTKILCPFYHRSLYNTRIKDFAFLNCHSLKTICIPNSVEFIGAGAFLANYVSANIYIDNTAPVNITIGTYGMVKQAFGNYRSTCTLYVPIGSKLLYESLPAWNDLNIVEMDFSNFNLPNTECNLSNLSTTSPYYDATADLCSRNIISGSDSPTNLGAVNVTDTLKRKHLAKIAFRGLYSTNGRTIPTTLPSDNYPTVYDDLSTQTSTNTYYYQAAKALLYLEYGDGISAFDRNKTNFNPDKTITRLDVLKVLLETFNIKPDLYGINLFPDDNDVVALMNNNPRKFGYISEAARLGIIATPSGGKNLKFRPFDSCLRGEAFVMLDRIIVAIENGTIANPNPQASAYHEPLNATLENLSIGLNQTNGNFNSYTKDVFSISGLMPMDFSFSYSSLATQLPDEFFDSKEIGSGNIDLYKSLGSGWSHSFDMFVNQVDDKYMVNWGSGKIDVYQKIVPTTGCPYFNPISKGIFDEAYMTYATNPCTDVGGTPGNNFVRQATKQENQYNESDIFYIKTKSFITYKFIRLSSNIFQLCSIKDRNGNLITINYQQGENNRMVISSITDGKRNLSFAYMLGTNLISTVTDPLNREATFDYSYNSTMNEYQLASFTDAKGQITKYYYGQSSDINQSKMLTKIKKPNGNYIENQYDLNLRLSKTTTGYNNVPKSETSIDLKTNYSDVSSASTSSTVKTSVDGKDVSFKFEYNKNNCNTSILGNNFNLSLGYDDNSIVQPTTVLTKSSKVRMVYDEKGNTTETQKISLINTDTLVTKMKYNDFNDITEIRDAKGNTTTYTYDFNGNLTDIVKPEGVETHYELNDKGQTIQKTDANGVITNYTYDNNDNPNSLSIPSLNITSNTNYDIVGRLIEDSNFKNLTTSFQYDDNDNLTKEIKPLNTTTRWTYDPNDNLKTIVNAKGGVTSMNYDQTTDNLTSVTFGSSIRQYEYNSDGTVKKIIKPDGTALAYTYDNLGNITDDGICNYTYDSTNYKVSTISRKNGNVLSYEYDGFGRIKAVNYNDFANNKVQYEYDKNNNILSVTYPGNKKINYTYDGLNRMKTITDWNNKTITYNYRKDSQLQSIEYPNGMTTNYVYDLGGRMVSKTTKRINGTIIAGYTNKLDSVGNITETVKAEPYQDVSISENEVNYSFDATNKIQTAGDVKFEINSNGNTTKRGNSVYTWYADDMLKSADAVVYEYDGLGNRRRNGNKHYFVDVMGIGNVIAETDASGTPTAYYIYGVGLEARILPNSTTEYYVSDNIGSTVAMVDASTSANVTHKYQYDDFGSITQSQESDSNPFRYIGRHGVMYDNDNLTYIRARYYDPTIGRFISEDPIWSTNLYSYTENNPINFIDIDGMQKVAPGDGLMTPKDKNNPNETNDTEVEKKQYDGKKGSSKKDGITDKTKKDLGDNFKNKSQKQEESKRITNEQLLNILKTAIFMVVAGVAIAAVIVVFPQLVALVPYIIAAAARYAYIATTATRYSYAYR